MRARYQRGYLRLGHRKTQLACWEFLWWDNEPTGRRVRRKAVIGTVQQYPNLEDAWQASNGLRISINEARNRQREQLITVADLIDHYTKTELAVDLGDEGKSPATRIIYKAFLGRWVRPAGGKREHPRCSHHCRQTLASSTVACRWQSDGSVGRKQRYAIS